MRNDAVRVTSVFNAAVSGSGASTTGVDITLFYGVLALNIAARAGGTNTMAIAIEHSDSLASGYTAVPAAALYDPSTGAPATFASVSTAATNQTLGLVTQQLRRFLRVTFSGSSLTQNVAVTLAGSVPYSETL
jgi:hypothetical protein